MATDKVDKHNLRKVILNFPRQLRIGWRAASHVRPPSSDLTRPNSVLVCGMGGSALPGDLLQIWLSAYKIGLPLYVHRNYGLPEGTDENHLIVVISYSGNTEETLTAFRQAQKQGLQTVCITSGGKLLRACQKYSVPAVRIPRGYQPRMALGFQFTALMKVLSNSGLIENQWKNISTLEKTLKPKTWETQGKKLAQKIKGKIPLIYSSSALTGLARIWKIKFNENSKIPAFYNYFPELNHNEIAGFSNPKNLSLFGAHIIILRDPADHPQNLKRIQITAQILKKKGVGVDILELKGKDVLYKVFSSILLADWASHYLALEYKIDPTPVKIVEELKKKLSSAPRW